MLSFTGTIVNLYSLILRHLLTVGATSSFSWKFSEQDDTEDEKGGLQGGPAVKVSCMLMKITENHSTELFCSKIDQLEALQISLFYFMLFTY